MRFLRPAVMAAIVNRVLSPPAHVRGMVVLNRTLFEKEVTLPSLTVAAVSASDALKHVKPFLLKLEKVKPVTHVTESIVEMLLDPDEMEDKGMQVQDLQDHLRTRVESATVKQGDVSLTLSYENWTIADVFNAVFPEDVHLSSWSHAGHVVHFNLDEQLVPYKQLIGQVMLDKVPNCRTVVNKVEKIDNIYRTFAMEVIAGDEDFLCTEKEQKCLFKFDFSKVYWNSRLGTEHTRITSLITKQDILYDVFAGIGPFAIPAAKKGVREVLANDLNPESYKWLVESCKLNKLLLPDKNSNIRTYNMDGAEFIRTVVKDHLTQTLCGKNSTNEDKDRSFHGVFHVVMNLPGLALSFLPSFIGLLSESGIDEKTLQRRLRVHCYCFAPTKKSKISDPELTVDSLVQKALSPQRIEDLEDYSVYEVRIVAPYRAMLCVSFYFPVDLLLKKVDQVEGSESAAKRLKLDLE